VKRYGEWDTYDNSRGEPRCHLLTRGICLNIDGFARTPQVSSPLPQEHTRLC
jgi:hypothetical protein